MIKSREGKIPGASSWYQELGHVKYPEIIGFIYAEDQFLARADNIKQIQQVVRHHDVRAVIRMRVIGDIVLVRLVPDNGK